MHERELGGLLGGLLDLPWVEVTARVRGEKMAAALSQYLTTELGGCASVSGQILETKHTISGKKVVARLFECRVRKRNLSERWIWMEGKSLGDSHLSSLTRRILNSVFEVKPSNFSLL
jgi:adenine-specific DNA glycosylase